MNAKWLLALPTALLAAGILLVACGGDGKESGPHRHGNEVWEQTASLSAMPSFLSDYSGRTNYLYGVVGKYEDIMKTVNCYCGCLRYENDPHPSLFRCYVAEQNEESVVWTDHSGTCGICTEELLKIDEWSKQGKTADEIRDLIEENFNPNAQA
ncbi:PCYCGC motif-containing (lipo)protein [Paenibacillaceae bacterium WGS1546]|uniref:PCYCGC motif-containing (lipo)protein n=1 Tax=Cohnella sp. WGS1546 TaxID=3366810 RepID=UPI00372D488F